MNDMGYVSQIIYIWRADLSWPLGRGCLSFKTIAFNEYHERLVRYTRKSNPRIETKTSIMLEMGGTICLTSDRHALSLGLSIQSQFPLEINSGGNYG